eukprot:2793160-Amphidinium_carterae.1
MLQSWAASVWGVCSQPWPDALHAHLHGLRAVAFESVFVQPRAHSLDAVARTLQKLRPNKAYDAHGLTTDVLQRGGEATVHTLYELLSSWFAAECHTDYLPRHWNVVLLSLLPKVADPSVLRDFRPIAVIPAIVKF